MSRQCLHDLQPPALLAVGRRSRLTGPCGQESDTTTVTAAGFPAHVSVTPILAAPLPQACWTALATSSEVMIAASSRELAQPVEAERGPDVEARYRH